jgi:hypothetical protein
MNERRWDLRRWIPTIWSAPATGDCDLPNEYDFCSAELGAKQIGII